MYIFIYHFRLNGKAGKQDSTTLLFVPSMSAKLEPMNVTKMLPVLIARLVTTACAKNTTTEMDLKK